MSEREEWGPWTRHNGEWCPCVGEVVEVMAMVNMLGEVKTFGPCIARGAESWTWRLHGWPPSEFVHIIRYRIRKPRALLELIEMVENPPEEVDA